jgi:hypothetical protein
MGDQLDKDALSRQNNLVPMEVLLPKGVIQTLDAKRIKSLVSGMPSDAPKEVDLRSRDTAIKHQDDGKCTAYSLTAALENTLQAKGNIPGLDMSEWHLWSFYRQYSAPAAIDAISRPANRVGDEKDYPQFGVPRAGMKGHTYIKASSFLGDDEGAMVRSLMAGHVVYLAMKTPREMLKCVKVISPDTGSASGGHALLIVGYYLDAGGKPLGIIRNSWGAECGDHGYQIMPMSVCHKGSFYCSMWSIDQVDTTLGVNPVPNPSPIPGPQPLPSPLPEPVPTPYKVCKRIWYAPWRRVCHTEVNPLN